MPRRDGTGPMGMGSMTGQGTGLCAGFAASGYANSTEYSIGFGCRRGFGRTLCATRKPGCVRVGSPKYAGIYDSTVDEKKLLSRQAEFLGNQLEQVKKRLSNLKEDTE